MGRENELIRIGLIGAMPLLNALRPRFVHEGKPMECTPLEFLYTDSFQQLPGLCTPVLGRNRTRRGLALREQPKPRCLLLLF